MNLLNAHKVGYSLPGRTLLENVDLTLCRGEKIGLVGRNGSGKSTLLRLLSGQLKPDAGSVTLRGQTRLRYLDQLPELDDCEGLSLTEVVTLGAPLLMELRRRYEKVCRDMEKAPPSAQREFESELNQLTDELTLNDAWDLETRADRILTTLGFPDPQQTLAGLSGGELKRVAMARTLLVPPDILLLDEPTNHLDIATIAWLEKFLKGANFTLLMVTHDRFFLERVCTRIVEVAECTLHSFQGNYSQYLELKAERESMKVRQQERFDNVMRQEKHWLAQGPKARSTKQKARLQRVQQMLDDGSGLVVEPGQTEDQAWDLGTRRLGKKVATLRIQSHKILKSIDFRLEPGERVGLVGSNGSGKTTFLKLLAGEGQPTDGTVEIGETVQTGYFDQHTDRLAHLPPETRVLDAVKDVAHSVPLRNGKELTAARLCEMFLFTGAQHATPIQKLSGGERKRLELLRILMSRPNLFLADEPTNDLDIETLSRLEFFLDGFPGCVCIASHDRFLLQRLCDRILVFREGRVEEVNPSVLDDVEASFFDPPKEDCMPKAMASAPTGSPSKTPSRQKLSYKEQSELKTLEESIPLWEEELKALEAEIAANANSYNAIKDLYEKKQTLDAKLEGGVERWAVLEELRESLED
jgi:ABC transport system ATP-binding/permease protein